MLITTSMLLCADLLKDWHMFTTQAELQDHPHVLKISLFFLGIPENMRRKPISQLRVAAVLDPQRESPLGINWRERREELGRFLGRFWDMLPHKYITALGEAPAVCDCRGRGWYTLHRSCSHCHLWRCGDADFNEIFKYLTAFQELSTREDVVCGCAPSSTP